MRLPGPGKEGRDKPGAIRCDEGTVGAVVSFSGADVRPAVCACLAPAWRFSTVPAGAHCGGPAGAGIAMSALLPGQAPPYSAVQDACCAACIPHQASGRVDGCLLRPASQACCRRRRRRGAWSWATRSASRASSCAARAPPGPPSWRSSASPPTGASWARRAPASPPGRLTTRRCWASLHLHHHLCEACTASRQSWRVPGVPACLLRLAGVLPAGCSPQAAVRLHQVLRAPGRPVLPLLCPGAGPVGRRPAHGRGRRLLRRPGAESAGGPGTAHGRHRVSSCSALVPGLGLCECDVELCDSSVGCSMRIGSACRCVPGQLVQGAASCSTA